MSTNRDRLWAAAAARAKAGETTAAPEDGRVKLWADRFAELKQGQIRTVTPEEVEKDRDVIDLAVRRSGCAAYATGRGEMVVHKKLPPYRGS